MKKIMFNDKYGLTKSVLEGKKTQTRRIIPNHVVEEYEQMFDPTLVDAARYGYGEIVAVAQCYKDCINPLDWISRMLYKDNAGWTNKMFVRADLMPHQIRITAVRVERLQDISDEDCLKEGIAPMIVGCEYYVFSLIDKEKGCFLDYKTPREAYAALIDKVSGKGTWDKNPYVFVYDFELVK